MAEYIDREKVFSLFEKSSECEYLGQVCYSIDEEQVLNLPTADVIEREKIDKAMEELEERIKYSKLPTVDRYNTYSEGLQDCLDIFKKHIRRKESD